MLTLRPADLKHLAQLSRPVNLLMAVLTYIFAAHASYLHSWAFLADSLFWVEGACILILMAGGYWVNDVFDYKIDVINKPERTLVGRFISSKKVLTAYFVSLSVAFLLTAWVCWHTRSWKYLAVNGGAGLALFVYARYLKRSAVLGNVVVAALTALVVVAGALLRHLQMVLLWAAIFAFVANLVREMVKDAEDIRGDLRAHLRTLPIVLGLRATNYVVSGALLLLLMLCWLPLVYHGWVDGYWAWPYAVAVALGVQLPVLWALLLVRRAVRPADYHRISVVLKGCMAAGLASMLLL